MAVTGATGFIGAAICRHLHALGQQVRVLARSPERARALTPWVTEVVAGDLHDAEALRRLVAGVDAVVHCAGVVRGAAQADFDRVNVQGLENLLSALATGAARLLSFSSLAAREPQLSFYARSKQRGEALLRAHARAVPWTILRPPAVYGPGDTELLPLFRLMAKGIAPVPGDPEARFSMLYVEDLAELVGAWLRRPQPPGGVYAPEDGTPGGYDWHEVAAIVGRLCDRRVRLLRVPTGLLAAPAWVNRTLARRFGYAPMLTPEKLRELRHPDWVCDSGPLTQLLGWQPRVRLEEGLRRTPGWCDRLASG